MHSRIARLLRRLHDDESGKLTVEQILLIAFITLPLLGVLIFFRDKVAGVLKSAWANVFGAGQTEPPR